jgi:hypothetical protein
MDRLRNTGRIPAPPLVALGDHLCWRVVCLLILFLQAFFSHGIPSGPWPVILAVLNPATLRAFFSSRYSI